MEISETPIRDVLVIRPRRLFDERGFFSEVFRQDLLAAKGVVQTWTQDNHSFSRDQGVIRGLHFQRPPAAQAKLVRVVRGAIFDVVVDLRIGSPTYGRHFGIELSSENWTQVYVPPGFAHGFCTLQNDTEVVYKVAGPYEPAAEGGLRWNDPDLGIRWPVGEAVAIVNDRDQNWPAFSNFASPFDR